MNKVQRYRRFAGLGALAAGVALSGCGMPGAPQPPSLNLPDRVTDLAASRAGNQVSLTWMMPKKNTDKLVLRDKVAVYVCRREIQGPCAAVGTVEAAPGGAGSFTETLPAELGAGAPRILTYLIELKNRNGRSAGPSNAATVLAGEAPAAVAGLDAEVRKSGVVLRWTPVAEEPVATAIRLHRKLLTSAATKPKEGPLSPQPEPTEQNLLVEARAKADRALDKDIHLGETYEYRAQRVARVSVDGRTLELDGQMSTPVRVEAKDVFPPDTPTGLAAVATVGENGGAPAIDLSWQAGTEADLAGYVVYRREGDGGWQRISPAQPVVGPAFHDGQVQAGHSYNYAVSAVDQGGHESARSAEAEETVPGP